MSTMTNGQVRKSLASQIDRLDHILDGLAEGLNEAVATAVKEAVALAVQEAVHGIVAEVLSNADLLAKLRGTIGVHTTDDSTTRRRLLPPRSPALASWPARSVPGSVSAGVRSARQVLRSPAGSGRPSPS